VTIVQHVVGRSTGGKPINLSHLQVELSTGGVNTSAGLGLADDYVFTYNGDGAPSDFATTEQAAVDQAIADHVAMRDKTDAEYSTEFQDPNTTVARKQEIRDITAGLLPREQVPMT
jgi:hypothetical protein